MIRLPALLAAGAALVLAACSGAPACGAGLTRDLLDEMIEEAFARSDYGQQLRPLVDYRLRSIQTIDHDQEIDRYACAATLEISLDDPDGPVVQQLIEYDVYLIKDDDGDFEISVDDGIDRAIAKAAVRRSAGQD